MKNVYGQFCPVAVACETFAERWTPLILRELVLGSRRFNEIHRGEMENHLTTARVMHADWLALSAAAQPGPETTSRSMSRRTLVSRAVLATVNAAMDVAGGAAFFRANGLERLFRDAQGARYHPMHEGAQRSLAGKSALGMEA